MRLLLWVGDEVVVGRVDFFQLFFRIRAELRIMGEAVGVPDLHEGEEASFNVLGQSSSGEAERLEGGATVA